MKKVVVLGGMGRMATSTSIDLSKNSKFEEIVIADGNFEGAKALGANLKDSRVSCVKFNAEDVKSIVNTIQGADIVINGLPAEGEAATLVRNTKQAVFDAGIKTLIDVNCPTMDGHLNSQSWEKSNLRYNEAGICAIFAGGGEINTSMALMGAKELDKIDEIHVYWGMSRPFTHGSPGLVDTLLWEEDPAVDARIYAVEGKIIKGAEPFSMIRSWHFPERVDKFFEGIVYAQTHSDPFLLAPAFPKVKLITSRGTWRKETNDFLRFMSKYDIYHMKPVVIDGNEVLPYKVLRNIWVNLCQMEEGKIRKGEKTVDDWGECVLEVEVCGLKDGIGSRSVYSCIPPEHPWHETFAKDPAREYGVYVGVPASITACLLKAGDIDWKPGIFSPADVIKDASKFIGELKHRGFDVYKRF